MKSLLEENKLIRVHVSESHSCWSAWQEMRRRECVKVDRQARAQLGGSGEWPTTGNQVGQEVKGERKEKRRET